MVDAAIPEGVAQKPIVHRIKIEVTICCPCNPLKPLFNTGPGRAGEVTCPDCGRGWRLNFLHFDEDDAIAPRDGNGQPQVALDYAPPEQGIAKPPKPTLVSPR